MVAAASFRGGALGRAAELAVFPGVAVGAAVLCGILAGCRPTGCPRICITGGALAALAAGAALAVRPRGPDVATLVFTGAIGALGAVHAGAAASVVVLAALLGGALGRLRQPG